MKSQKEKMSTKEKESIEAFVKDVMRIGLLKRRRNEVLYDWLEKEEKNNHGQRLF